MIPFKNRSSAEVVALLTLLVACSPLARVEAQAAAITMPKQAAQRAAAASNAQLQGQMNQAQNAQAIMPGAASAGAQSQAAGQQRGATPGVVQSGGTRTGAPDPGATAGPGAAGAAAPDPTNKIMREVFDYSSEGRRDPFFSLMATGDIRPMLSDLRLTTILYDPSGRRPVAVMNDITSNLQYRVTTGMMLGRMRVTRIKPRAVIFEIEEFGFSRSDSILLADKPLTRK
jgi:hypothetical protein